MQKVLVIADNWERLDHFEKELLPQFSVLCAPFGREGIQLAVDHRPDHIVIDVGFEDMTADEIEAALVAHPLLATIPRVIVMDNEADHPPARLGSTFVSSARAWSELATILLTPV